MTKLIIAKDAIIQNLYIYILVCVDYYTMLAIAVTLSNTWQKRVRNPCCYDETSNNENKKWLEIILTYVGMTWLNVSIWTQFEIWVDKFWYELSTSLSWSVVNLSWQEWYVLWWFINFETVPSAGSSDGLGCAKHPQYWQMCHFSTLNNLPV